MIHKLANFQTKQYSVEYRGALETSAFTWLLVLKSLKLSEYDEYCLRMTITVSQHTEFSNRKWVGYAVSWTNIALLTPMFPETVGHVIAREVPRSRSNNTAVLRSEAFCVAPL